MTKEIKYYYIFAGNKNFRYNLELDTYNKPLQLDKTHLLVIKRSSKIGRLISKQSLKEANSQEKIA